MKRYILMTAFTTLIAMGTWAQEQLKVSVTGRALFDAAT